MAPIWLASTFTGVATYSISGTISPASMGSGATVTLSGAASATTTADESGNYSFHRAAERRLHGYTQQDRVHLHTGEPGGYRQQC